MRKKKINFWSDIKKPLCGLAPMAGVTDEPMRKIYSVISEPDVVYTEFISAEGFFRNRNFFVKQLEFSEAERPVVVQIYGSDPYAISALVSLVLEKGFDGVDINMGCPARTVIEKGGGGALIGNVKLAEKIIVKAYEVIAKSGKNIPLSVKTRIGKIEDESDNWGAFLSEMPIDAICIHGRLLKEGNTGPVNWEGISKAGKIIRGTGKVFLGNGGLKTRKEGDYYSMKYGLDGVLIGKAAFGNPWLFKDREPSKEEILDVISRHAEMGWRFYGRENFIRMRKHFGWYPRGFRGAKEMRVELLKTTDLKEVREIISKFR